MVKNKLLVPISPGEILMGDFMEPLVGLASTSFPGILEFRQTESAEL